MSLIAITGGIGAGKTTVLNAFRRLGAFGLDADDVAHSMYEPGSAACGEMVARWGTGILTPASGIDRKKVAGIVFGNDAERSWLNHLLHPMIRDEMEKQARECQGPCFCAIPLLYESKWEASADAVIAIWCTPEDQAKRLAARGWSPEQCRQRLATQLTMDEKLARADYAILSSCSWSSLERQCRRLMDRLA